MAARKLTAAALIALTSCALTAGCGNDSAGAPASDEEQITEAIQTAYGAFAKLDAETFCAQLTADFRADFEASYGPCQRATLEQEVGKLSEDQRAKLTDPEIGAIKIDGASAYPDVNGDGLEIEREGEVWKLDDFDLPR